MNPLFVVGGDCGKCSQPGRHVTTRQQVVIGRILACTAGRDADDDKDGEEEEKTDDDSCHEGILKLAFVDDVG